MCVVQRKEKLLHFLNWPLFIFFWRRRRVWKDFLFWQDCIRNILFFVFYLLFEREILDWRYLVVWNLNFNIKKMSDIIILFFHWTLESNWWSIVLLHYRNILYFKISQYYVSLIFSSLIFIRNLQWLIFKYDDLVWRMLDLRFYIKIFSKDKSISTWLINVI